MIDTHESEFSDRKLPEPTHSYTRWLLSSFFLSMVVTTAARLALTFDGSYQLLRALRNGYPCIFFGRYSFFFFHEPVLIAQKFVGNLDLLSWIYCVGFAAVPLFSISMCLLLLRGSTLLIFPVIAIGLLSLPLQPSQFNDNLINCCLAWPMYLSMLRSRSPKLSTAVLINALFLFGLHPTSSVFLALAGGSGLIVEAQRRRIRFSVALVESFRSFPLPLILLVMAVLRVALLFGVPADYEKSALTVGSLWDEFRYGIGGATAVTLLGGLALSLWILISAKSAEKRSFLVSLLFFSVTAVSIFSWSCDAQSWYQTMHYGRFLFVSFSVLMLCALWETVRQVSGNLLISSVALESRRALVFLIAGVFLMVGCEQSIVWYSCTEKLKAELAERGKPYLQMEEQPWMRGTPIDHWSCVSLSVILQGRHPEHLLITDFQKSLLNIGKPLKLAPWEDDFKNGYFILPGAR